MSAGAGRRRNPLVGLLFFLLRWSGLLVVPGGVLWALSPIGVAISETLFNTPNIFWKAFPSAPLILLVGLVGLHLKISRPSGGFGPSGGSGALETVGAGVVLLGLLLTLLGSVGEFWLGTDNAFIMTAPGYRAFRLGLLVFAAGSVLLGVAVGRDRSLPVAFALPFALASLCGLVSFSADLNAFGAALWIAFGLGWAWLGVGLLADPVARLFGRAKAGAATGASGG